MALGSNNNSNNNSDTKSGKNSGTNSPEATGDSEGGQAQRKSLVAFLRAIKFRQPQRSAGGVERYFAQPQPTARQRSALAEERYWVRSAN